MKHILITGGAGFIGSHLCEVFLGKGYAVTVLDNLVTGRLQNLEGPLKSPHFQFISYNVSDPFTPALLDSMKLLKQHGLSGLLHFACPASPIDFARIPFEILAVDSLGAFNTVDLALKYDARYVLASTSEIYGDPLEHPQKETYWGNVNTLGSRACYDETKRFAEALVSTAMTGVGEYKGKTYKALNAAIVRIFNTYGPRMRPDDGRVVPEFCMNALKHEPLKLDGAGTQTRSFCYVDDLVDGIVKLYESNHKEVVNIGNTSERSMKNLAEIVIKLAKSKSTLQTKPPREDDPKQRCPDISKAKRLLDWEPKVSIEQGIGRCLEYFQTFV